MMAMLGIIFYKKLTIVNISKVGAFDRRFRYQLSLPCCYVTLTKIYFIKGIKYKFQPQQPL